MKLVLVEAPTKARHIQKFLGNEYIVKASLGHVLEMPLAKNMTKLQKEKYGKYAQDLTTFEPLYKIMPDKTKLIAELRKLLPKVDEVIISTDNDDEGALIGLHLVNTLKPSVPVYRATWNEITEKAVRAGLKDKELIDVSKKLPKSFFGQAESALSRAQWDRLFGFAASPLSWRVRPNTSAGRVQTPGTRLVVEREERRLAFKSIDYYNIFGVFEGHKAKLYQYKGMKIADASKINDEGEVAKGYHLITDKDILDIKKDLESKKYIVGDVSSKPYRRQPPPPFTTSSALQSIGSKTRMPAKQITSILQGLYQDSLTTYIRTVSIEAAPDAVTAAREELKQRFGANMVSKNVRNWKNKKSDNSGHECIRNVLDEKTGKLVSSARFKDAKAKEVFDLVRLRFLASQSIDSEGTTWSASFVSDEGETIFNASETIISEPGWTKVYQLDEEVGA